MKIGLFVFDRGWNETEIIEISDGIFLRNISNSKFFKGDRQRFNFNKEHQIFHTDLLNLTKFESEEEQELVTMLIPILESKNIIIDNFERLDITIDKQMQNYFAELK